MINVYANLYDIILISGKMSERGASASLSSIYLRLKNINYNNLQVGVPT